MSKHYPFQSSDQFYASIDNNIDAVIERVNQYGFTIWPFGADPDHGIPTGFCTVGMTRVGLPEFYVSGVMPHSPEADDIIERFRRLHAYARQGNTLMSAMQLCTEVNLEFAEGGKPAIHQWRPVDGERLMYGQATIIRYWADAEGLCEIVQGIQIVRRDERGEFPLHSTSEQLLLDWIPFGAKPYILPEEVTSNVSTI